MVIVLKDAIRFDCLPLLQRMVNGWSFQRKIVNMFFESAKDWVAPLKVNPAGAWDKIGLSLSLQALIPIYIYYNCVPLYTQ